MPSPVMTNDENHRKEFKEQILRRVYDALNKPVKIKAPKTSDSKVVTVKGLMPRGE